MLINEYDVRRQNVKRYAKIKNVPLWRVAWLAGINDGNLSRRLRHLSEDQEKAYCRIIDQLADGEVADGEVTNGT